MSRGYLLDTSVVSVFGPGRRDLTAPFAEWARAKDDELYLSSVTMFEISQGIAKLARQGTDPRVPALELWRDGLSRQFGSRQLSLDEAIADIGGRLSDKGFALGRHPGFLDILIAATALANDLTLLTRNLRHFLPLGIDVVDPLDRLPS